MSLNAIIYLRQNRVPQRGCQTSTLMIYRDPFDSCTNSCNLEAASRGSSIVSPSSSNSILFFIAFFFFSFFDHVFTYRRNHPPARKLGWRHNGRPGITRSPSVLKSPSITRIGRLPTSNIIIIISLSLHCEKGINATQWREKRARFVDTLMTNNKSLYIYRRYFTKLSLKLYRFEEG